MTVEGVRAALRERMARGATLEELDTLVRMTRGIGQRQRDALLAEAWHPREALRRTKGVRAAMSRVARRG